MAFLKILDKRKVPEELPNLTTDEVKSKREESKKEEITPLIKEEIKKIDEPPKTDTGQIIDKKEIENTPENNQKEIAPQIKIKNVNESRFFGKLQENISKEIGDLDKLEKFYNNKIVPKDTILEMKTFWEKQKADSILQILGKDFQEKITKKIGLLQELEKNWQEIYFDLIEKENEIKENEQELKKMLGEFIVLCKKRMENEKKDTRVKKKKR